MLFEMINQEFQVLGRKYQVLPNFGICCRELRGLKVTSFRACVRSFCSVVVEKIASLMEKVAEALKSSGLLLLSRNSFRLAT